MGQSALELWGGIECTLNRVGDTYFDQLEFSSHSRRIADLDRVASLGLRTIRYPLLWERAAPSSPSVLDFRFADERLPRLQALGIEPIAGLVHHGSGPAYTSLVDPAFPGLLAGYALALARRYPWLRRFTPVNEPLTTARFSGLYGHWYPHARSDHVFARALLNQVWGTIAAMRAIRSEIPGAELVQTEDLGYVRSTPELQDQADFENERRFLGLDLLCGLVSRGHPLYRYLRSSGVTARELAELQDNPCPPDVLGFNYYVTGERFLDSRTQLYPRHVIGGNASRRYADVEAVRVCGQGLLGPATLLSEAYSRFQLPLAVTEAHIAGAPEDQARWLSYIWSAALQVRARGVPLRAVTAWSLFGAYGWDELVTRGACSYEAGAFAVQGDQVVETPFAGFLRALARGAAQVVDGGWWRSPERLLYEEPTEADCATSAG